MDGFGGFIDAEIPRLRRYARALLRNPVDADDLVQETLVRALTKQHLWERGSDLRAWLFTMMHNQYVNFVRKSVRSGEQVPVETILDIGRPGAQMPSLELQELDAAMARLPDEQRAVLLLIGLEGMSYEEAATVVQVPVGTVRSRLSRGREALRDMLDAPERRCRTTPESAPAEALAAAPHSARGGVAMPA